jgi:hypothetical protein
VPDLSVAHTWRSSAPLPDGYEWSTRTSPSGRAPANCDRYPDLTSPSPLDERTCSVTKTGVSRPKQAIRSPCASARTEQPVVRALISLREDVFPAHPPPRGPSRSSRNREVDAHEHARRASTRVAEARCRDAICSFPRTRLRALNHFRSSGTTRLRAETFDSSKQLENVRSFNRRVPATP